MRLEIPSTAVGSLTTDWGKKFSKVSLSSYIIIIYHISLIYGGCTRARARAHTHTHTHTFSSGFFFWLAIVADGKGFILAST
jgi:hypothetical protein